MSLTPGSVGAFDVMDVLRQTIQAAMPGAKRAYFERLDKANLPALSFELISYSSPQVDSQRVRRSLDLDVVYLSRSNTVGEALEVMGMLGDILPFGLPVKDRFIYPAEGPEMRLVDQDLHMLITYEWLDLGAPVVITESGKLGWVEPEETSPGNVIKEQDPYLKPITGLPVVDEEGQPITDDVFIRPEFDYMHNLIVEMEE